MESTLFKYEHKHHHQQQNQHFNRKSNNMNQNNNSSISSHNNNNQNSIFILNTATNNILPNNPQLYYSDLKDNNVVSSSSASSCASSSVWSSASSTMCSPAAHALQKLFNCSSSSFKMNHGYYSGIESKTFKSKAEILKKKSKFWKYLEGKDNDKSNQRGIDDADATEKKLLNKSLKHKSNHWLKSFESANQNQQDLSELLEYTCSLCDNCRCVDCQIGYFDYENSDDSNSEYSFHLSAYDEDEDASNSDHENVPERQMELKSFHESHYCLQATCDICCNENDEKQRDIRKLEINFGLPINCSNVCCACSRQNCTKAECCRQCFLERTRPMDGGHETAEDHQPFITSQDH